MLADVDGNNENRKNINDNCVVAERDAGQTGSNDIGPISAENQ